MKINTLNRFSANQIKALFGFAPQVLGQIIELALPQIEQAREQRLKTDAGRLRRFVHNDGRPREVLPIDKLLMCLLYLRHNASHTVIGAMLGFSADSSENAFSEVLPVLKELFPAEKWEAEKRHRKESKWTPDEIDQIIIDSFETPLPRPSQEARQKRLYSGKKRRHTLKTQVITDQRGEILSINAAHRGAKADVKLFEETQLPEEIKDKPRLGDKAYIGANPEIRIPHKKPKGRELSQEQKAENKQIAQERIYVEHGIRRIKSYRIMRDEYRMATGLFKSVASVVVGLIQFARITG